MNPNSKCEICEEEKAHRIEIRLTNDDVEAWHAGEMTAHVEELMNAVGADCIQIWGSREGPEPLTVTVKEG